MTPAMTWILLLKSNPLHDAMRTYVPSGGSIALFILMDQVPPCGVMVMFVGDALERSMPTKLGVDSDGVDA